MLSTGNLPLGGLPRNSVARIIELPEMTSAVYHECKASIQTKSFSHFGQLFCCLFSR